VAGEAVRDGARRQKPDWQRSVRGILHRPAQVDRQPSRLQLRHPPRAGSHVRSLRPGNKAVERNRQGAHGQGELKFTSSLFR